MTCSEFNRFHKISSFTHLFFSFFLFFFNSLIHLFSSSCDDRFFFRFCLNWSEIFLSRCIFARLSWKSVFRFMNFLSDDQINNCYQLGDFIRTNHKFSDLISSDTKFFVSDHIFNDFSDTSKSSRKTRSSRSSKNITWSQIWAIDRNEFKKAVMSFEKAVELLFSFSKNHSRESFKNFISSQSFASSKLILFDSLSLLNIVDQTVKTRDKTTTSFFLTSASSSSVKKSSNARFYSNFNFTSRSYEILNQKTDHAFATSKQVSQNLAWTKSILDFIENSRSSTTAQSFIWNTMNFAKSISVLQFVLHSKVVFSTQSARNILNLKLTFSRQFSSRSITSESDEQTARTTVKYEISRNIFTIEQANIMSQEFIETQRRELMIMMQEF